jgi:hypothetical protein
VKLPNRDVYMHVCLQAIGCHYSIKGVRKVYKMEEVNRKDQNECL